MLSRWLFWCLLPVSALQGLWLRRVARRLPGAGGAREGVVGAGEPLYLLALGDSIIDGVGIESMVDAVPGQFAAALAQHRSRRVHWLADGLSGRTIDDLVNRLAVIGPSIRADIVLLSIGVNDVTGLSSKQHWRRRLEELLEGLERCWPGVRIVFAGLPEMGHFPLPPQPLRFSLGLRAGQFDRIAARTIAAQTNALHVPTRINPEAHPFCADGFHPAAESCTLWARELAAIESGGNQNERSD